MSKRYCYILVVEAGPSRKEQLAIINPSADDIVMIDDARNGVSKLVEREKLLLSISNGDTLAVSSPGRLGINRTDILKVMERLVKIGVDIDDISSGKKLSLREDKDLAAVFFISSATSEQRRLIMTLARMEKTKKGINGGRPPKQMLLSESEILKRWHDKENYPSAKKIAASAGVTERTLYSKFGPRNNKKGE